MTDADRISIYGIRGFGYHGVLEAERINGQEFTVDVVLDVDISDAARTDDLTHTVDYGSVAQRVHSHITGTPHDLIETLAERIATDLLAAYAINAVQVVVHKPSAPIPVPFTDVTVSITRRR